MNTVKGQVCLSAGFACLLAGFYTYDFTDWFFPFLSSRTLIASAPTFLSYGAVAGGLFVIPLFSRFYGRLLNHPKASFLGALLVIIGNLFAFNAGSLNAEDPMVIASAVAVGLGSSYLWIMWGELIATFTFAEIKSCISNALLLSIFLYLCALILPNFIALLLMHLLPLLSWILLRISIKQWSMGKEEKVEKNGWVMTQTSRWKSYLVETGIPHFGVALAVLAIWSLANITQVTAGKPFLFLSFGMGAIFALCLMFLNLERASKVDLSSLVQYSFPLLILSMIILLVFHDKVISFVSFLLVCSMNVFVDYLSWTLFCQFGHVCKENVSKIIGWGRCFVHAGMFVGSLVGFYFVSAYQKGIISWEIIASSIILWVVLVSMIGVLIDRRRNNSLLHYLRTLPPKKLLVKQSEEALFKTQFRLTNREFEIMAYLREGLSSSQIQDELFLSKNTVSSHMKSIYKKFDVHSRMELDRKIDEVLYIKAEK
jgi:DNA-binding CsgD family transcriptional regulator